MAKSELEKLLQTAIKEGNDKLVEEIEELQEAAGIEAKGLLEKAKKSACQAQDAVDGYIHDNPAKSLLVSLGVGALLGYLLGRK